MVKCVAHRSISQVNLCWWIREADIFFIAEQSTRSHVDLARSQESMNPCTRAHWYLCVLWEMKILINQKWKTVALLFQFKDLVALNHSLNLSEFSEFLRNPNTGIQSITQTAGEVERESVDFLLCTEKLLIFVFSQTEKPETDYIKGIFAYDKIRCKIHGPQVMIHWILWLCDSQQVMVYFLI